MRLRFIIQMLAHFIFILTIIFPSNSFGTDNWLTPNESVKGYQPRPEFILDASAGPAFSLNLIGEGLDKYDNSVAYSIKGAVAINRSRTLLPGLAVSLFDLKVGSVFHYGVYVNGISYSLYPVITRVSLGIGMYSTDADIDKGQKLGFDGGLGIGLALGHNLYLGLNAETHVIIHKIEKNQKYNAYNITNLELVLGFMLY